MKNHLPSLALAATLAALLAACNGNDAPAGPPAVEVGFITVKSQSVPLSVELTGRVNASSSAEVRPQVSGILKARLFKEGSYVKAGQVLYEIDAAPYRAAFEEAKAALSNAEATLNSTKLKSDRYGELTKIDGVAKQDADDAKATYLQAVATIAEKKAALETARINLDYTRIKAPISGRIGISSVTPGALVTASQTTALATIRTLDPIYIDLTQSSVDQLKLAALLGEKQIRSGSGQVKILLEDGTTYGHPATLQFGEIAVDENTGSVTLRAEATNPEGKLLPGMFVRAQLDQAVDSEGILVPQQGIAQNPKGDATAMVIDAANKVVERQVTLRRSFRDSWLVSSGLAVGDHLIIEGLSKIKAGQTVKGVEVSPPANGASATSNPAAGVQVPAQAADKTSAK